LKDRREATRSGTDALDALFVVQRDGLGVGRVGLTDGALWFADPADRELCAALGKSRSKPASDRGPAPRQGLYGE
jgi:hypothetical protein